MGRLTDTARDAFDVNRNKTEVPWWLPRVGLAVFAVVVAWTVVGSLRSSGPEPTATSSVPVVVVPGGEGSSQSLEETVTSIFRKAGSSGRGTNGRPAGPTTTTPTTTTPSGSRGGDGGATVALDGAAGTRIPVPLVALELARQQVLAADGAEVLGTSVVSATDGDITFSFTVDGDGSGPGSPQPRTVRVVLTGGLWDLAPAA